MMISLRITYLSERLSTLCRPMVLRCDVSLYSCRTLLLGYVSMIVNEQLLVANFHVVSKESDSK